MLKTILWSKMFKIHAVVKKRLYFIAPNIEKATEIIRSLWDQNLTQEGVQILVKEKLPQNLKKIQSERRLESTDFKAALLKGLFIGGITGLTTGLLIFRLHFQEFTLHPADIGLFSILGALFGAWTSSLIGVSVPNPHFVELKHALQRGEIIIELELPEIKEREIIEYMRFFYSDISYYETECTA